MQIKNAWNALWAGQPVAEQKNTGHQTNITLTQLFGLGQARWSEGNYQSISREAFYKNVVAYKCVMLRANSVGNVKFCLYKGDDEITAHPVLDLLMSPNPIQGGQSLVTQLIAHKALSGNGYLHAVRPTPGRAPRELWTLRPDRVIVNRGVGRFPLSYQYNPTDGGGKGLLFPVDQMTGKCDVLNLMNFNPLDDFIGTSALQPGARPVDIFNEGQEWNKKLLQNGARPSGALSTDAELTKEQVDELYTKIDERFTGSENAGRPLVLAGGLTWQEMGLSPKDVEYLESKHSAARDIATALGVPPILLHLPGDVSYNNASEARVAFFEETVLPEADFIAGELTRWLLPMFGDNLRLEINDDEIAALAPRRKEKWDAIQGATFLTINEKRTSLGYEPVEGGDTLLVPSNLLPLNDPLDGLMDEVEPQTPPTVEEEELEEVTEDSQEEMDDDDTEA